MAIQGMDKDYVRCSKQYLQNWRIKYQAEDCQISEEVLEEIILLGGGGLKSLETTFANIIKHAKEQGVKEIDINFVRLFH